MGRGEGQTCGFRCCRQGVETDGSGCWGLDRERERQICVKERACVDCGFFNFASLDGSGALDVKENEALTAEIWLFVVP